MATLEYKEDHNKVGFPKNWLAHMHMACGKGSLKTIFGTQFTKVLL
jgi:hypothetical protein